MNDHTKNLDWIQLLRGVAALMVVLAHARYALLNTDSYALADQLFRPGAMGVDLFFLISGFIMCYSTARSDGSPAYALRFLLKRWARVWPVYAVVTLLAIFVLHGGLDYFHYGDQRKAFWHSLAMLPVNPHHAPYFDLTLGVGWTLEFEMYFYLVFAACLLFGRLRWLALAAWIGVTVFVLPQGMALDVERDYGGLGYMNIVTNPFVLEFGAGALIGWLYLQPWFRLPGRGRQLAWHLAGLGCAFAAWAIYSGAVGGHGPLHAGWPLALMLLALALASKTVRIAAPPLALWLGGISYSLYLTHLLSQRLLEQAMAWAGVAPLVHTWGYIFLSTACALSLAALSHRYLEQGLSNRVRDWLLRPWARRPAGTPA